MTHRLYKIKHLRPTITGSGSITYGSLNDGTTTLTTSVAELSNVIGIGSIGSSGQVLKVNDGGNALVFDDGGGGTF